jgi:hypothetical protein
VYRIVKGPTMTRRILAILLTALAGSFVLAAPAQATDYYRYWTFFTVENGEYVASDLGVGAVKPADGSTEAFRWAAPADYKNPNLPRVDLTTVTFDSVCGDTPAVDGQKRVVVVVDFGVEEDAEGATVPEPVAECSQVDEEATALQVLQRVAEVRSKTSSMGPLLCAIDGYPATGCADDVVQTATPADSGFVTVASDQSDDSSQDDDNNVALYAGLAAIVAALAVGGFFVARRNRSA